MVTNYLNLYGKYETITNPFYIEVMFRETITTWKEEHKVIFEFYLNYQELIANPTVSLSYKTNRLYDGLKSIGYAGYDLDNNTSIFQNKPEKIEENKTTKTSKSELKSIYDFLKQIDLNIYRDLLNRLRAINYKIIKIIFM